MEICSLKCVLDEFAIQNLGLIYFCTSEIFKPGLNTNNPYEFVYCVGILKDYFAVKTMVLNDSIKAFGYTKYIID